MQKAMAFECLRSPFTSIREHFDYWLDAFYSLACQISAIGAGFTVWSAKGSFCPFKGTVALSTCYVLTALPASKMQVSLRHCRLCSFIGKQPPCSCTPLSWFRLFVDYLYFFKVSPCVENSDMSATLVAAASFSLPANYRILLLRLNSCHISYEQLMVKLNFICFLGDSISLRSPGSP